MESKFVNRYEDRTKANKLIAKTNVIIVASESGVGKSTFIDHITKTFGPNAFKVRVKMPFSVLNHMNQNFYIEKICLEIDRLVTKNKKFTHLESFEGYRTRRGMSARGVLKTVDALTGKNLTGFSDSLFKEQEIISVSTSETELKLDYIKEILSKTKSIVHIDNIQSIDSHSYMNLLLVMEYCTETNFFLEYMLSKDSNESKFYRFIDDVQEYISKVGYMKLKVFKESHFYEYCNANGITENQHIYYQAYEENNGNFISLKYIDDTEDGTFKIKSIEESVEQLNSLEKMVSATIAMYFDEITENVLYELVNADDFKNTISYRELETITDNLLEKEIIEKYEFTYRISHDSIKEIILSDQLMLTSRKLIVGAIEKYYLKKIKLLNNDLEESRKFKERLIILYLRHSPEFLVETKQLEILIELSLSYPLRKFTKPYLFKVEGFADKYTEVFKLKLKKSLVDTHYTVGNFDEALRILEEIFDENNEYHYTYKALILSRTNAVEHALEFIEDIEQGITNEHAVLQLKLCKIITLIILSRYSEKDEIIDELLSSGKFEQYYEYGYVLKLSEERFRNDVSIPYIVKSIEHFESFDDIVESSKSRITLAAQYGNIGKVDLAKKELLKAYNTLFNRSLELRNIKNNLGVCEYLINNNGVAELKSALGLVTNKMNQLMITNNLFSVLCMNGNTTQAAKYVSFLTDEGSFFDYASIRITTNFNLHVYYKDIGEDTKSKNFFDFCISDLEHVDEERQEYWKSRLLGQSYIGKGFKRVFKERYHLSFMSVWDFTFVN